MTTKHEMFNRLLSKGGSVFIHLDSRREDVCVPEYLRGRPQLVLQIGLNLPISIRDLLVSENSVSCTLLFGRTPFHCTVPWSAVYGLVSDDNEVVTFPRDIPRELLNAKGHHGQSKEAAPPRPKLVLVKGGRA